ncbi:glycosyltransferase family 1 protein [Methylosinus sp. Sm6]|uniref:glycosyltransferase family 4 protein n=1 Tax=Methylosinus sp. Sm6 TaxID=2866948 RepID=UPI001C9A1FED|nr:glycosyltransferase family 1 protein [Methylosinus sp. Sm6]MBY6241348.1 glycosyltransferase family 4 protein [Methylosinus sp. Sm6]
MNAHTINSYIACELHKEIGELEQRVVSLESERSVRLSRRFSTLRERLLSGARGAAIGRGVDVAAHPAPVEAEVRRARAAPAGERLLIDMTNTIRCEFVSGIQRVVRRIAAESTQAGAGIGVVFEDGELYACDGSSQREKVEIAAGDKFVMADAAWHDARGCRRVMDEVSREGGMNILILHDIHPLLYPGLFHPQNVEAFSVWFDKVAIASDALVAVSRSSAEEFLDYVIASGKRVNPAMRIGWSHPGADVDADAEGDASEQVAAICASETPFFLSVGTLEPKKGYSISLDAFERAWASGVDARFVMVGRRGWNTRALERRILSHAEFGRRLFWLDAVGGADLTHLYRHAHRLVAASVAEGFGLPLVEATHFGLQAIASDIPVFREVGGDAATYFDVADIDGLAARIGEACARRNGLVSLPRRRSWRDAAAGLFELIRHEDYQFGSFAWRLAGSDGQYEAEPTRALRAVS